MRGILLKHGLLCSFIQREPSLQPLRLLKVANHCMGSGIDGGFASEVNPYLNYNTGILMALSVLVVVRSAVEPLSPLLS